MEFRGAAGDEGTAFATPRQWATLIRVVTIGMGILLLLLVVRIVSLALGGDESGMIVGGVIGLTGPFVEPFRALLRFPALPGGAKVVLDGAAVTAFIFWTSAAAFVLGYLAPRVDAARIDWPPDYDRRYGTIVSEAPVEPVGRPEGAEDAEYAKEKE